MKLQLINDDAKIGARLEANNWEYSQSLNNDSLYDIQYVYGFDKLKNTVQATYTIQNFYNDKKNQLVYGKETEYEIYDNSIFSSLLTQLQNKETYPKWVLYLKNSKISGYADMFPNVCMMIKELYGTKGNIYDFIFMPTEDLSKYYIKYSIQNGKN